MDTYGDDLIFRLVFGILFLILGLFMVLFARRLSQQWLNDLDVSWSQPKWVKRLAKENPQVLLEINAWMARMVGMIFMFIGGLGLFPLLF